MLCHIYRYIYIYIYISRRLALASASFLSACIPIWPHVNTYVRVYTYIYIHMHAYAYMHRQYISRRARAHTFACTVRRPSLMYTYVFTNKPLTRHFRLLAYAFETEQRKSTLNSDTLCTTVLRDGLHVRLVQHCGERSFASCRQGDQRQADVRCSNEACTRKQ